MGKNKKPKRSVTPPGGHAARVAADPVHWFNEKFMVSMRRLDFDGPFGWSKATAEDYTTALRRLKDLESLTWREILNDQGKLNHAIPVAELSPEAQKRLSQIHAVEFDELVSLRLTGKYRIWGFRIGQTLCLLWYDPEHQVYPVNVANN